MGITDSLPRKSVLKAIAGVTLLVAPIAMVILGYRSLGIFGLVPMFIGAMLTKEYFRELGFNS